MDCADFCADRYSLSVRGVPVVLVQETPNSSAFVGWGARTRTWEWRNQNPPYPSPNPLTKLKFRGISANAVPDIVRFDRLTFTPKAATCALPVPQPLLEAVAEAVRLEGWR